MTTNVKEQAVEKKESVFTKSGITRIQNTSTFRH